MGDQTPYMPVAPGQTAPKARLTKLQKAELIRSVGIFSDAAVEELFRLAAIAQEVDFAAQETIFREGDIGDAFYLVVQGKVASVARSGTLREVSGPGEVVGLYSVLTREPRFTTATALEDTFAISIGAEDLYSLLSNNMEIVVSIFKHFVKRLGMGPKA
jgi:CRP-like cAMP-binding protein